MGNSDYTVAITATEMSKGKSDAPKKRTRKKSHFDIIRTKAVSLFKYSLEKTAEEKVLCMKKALAYYKQKENYSEADFKKDYYKRVSTLLDNRSFCKHCEDKGFAPYDAATHLVFYNCKTKIAKLILYADYSAFDTYEEWNTPIFKEEDLKVHTVGAQKSCE